MSHRPHYKEHHSILSVDKSKCPVSAQSAERRRHNISGETREAGRREE